MKIAATVKCIFADGGYAIGDCKGCQRGARKEGIFSDAFCPIRNFNVGKSRAIIERVSSDIGYSARNRNICKMITVIKCIVANSHDPVGKCDR